jgi:hypothetical protein
MSEIEVSSISCVGCGRFEGSSRRSAVVEKLWQDILKDAIICTTGKPGWWLCDHCCEGIAPTFVVQKSIIEILFFAGSLDPWLCAHGGWLKLRRVYCKLMNLLQLDHRLPEAELREILEEMSVRHTDEWWNQLLHPMCLTQKDGELLSPPASEPSFPDMVGRRKLWAAIAEPFDGRSLGQIWQQLDLKAQGSPEPEPAPNEEGECESRFSWDGEMLKCNRVDGHSHNHTAGLRDGFIVEWSEEESDDPTQCKSSTVAGCVEFLCRLPVGHNGAHYGFDSASEFEHRWHTETVPEPSARRRKKRACAMCRMAKAMRKIIKENELLACGHDCIINQFEQPMQPVQQEWSEDALKAILRARQGK